MTFEQMRAQVLAELPARRRRDNIIGTCMLLVTVVLAAPLIYFSV